MLNTHNNNYYLTCYTQKMHHNIIINIMWKPKMSFPISENDLNLNASLFVGILSPGPVLGHIRMNICMEKRMRKY